jgi:hypothetical protein
MGDLSIVPRLELQLRWRLPFPLSFPLPLPRLLLPNWVDIRNWDSIDLS